MQCHTVFISIGSNIGNKLENCGKGIATLTRTVETVLLKKSGFYRTEPVDYTDQDWFVNCAVKIKTSLNPFELLTELKRIEAEAGRKNNSVRFGPRVLDLDIIFFDDQTLNSDNLVIPHPRMHQRRFVLRPICDIEPDVIHPAFKKDMVALLAELGDNYAVKLIV